MLDYVHQLFAHFGCWKGRVKGVVAGDQLRFAAENRMDDSSESKQNSEDGAVIKKIQCGK